MADPLAPDKALYLPVEIISRVDFGPLEITFGTQSVDADGNLVYDSDGNPSQDSYDLSGYTASSIITSTTTSAPTGSQAFTVATTELSAGKIGLSLTDTETTALEAWKDTAKPTEKIGEYRVILEIGATKKCKVYGPISLNSAGV